MRRRFVTLDVFTAQRYAGNPLAVVLDPEGLDGAAMQAVAREFNLSETVFVLPPQEPAHRARLRIFTPALEIPFAGHPTVGTAVLLATMDGAGSRELVLEEGVGNLRCFCEPRGTDSGYARFAVPRLPQEGGKAADTNTIAAALSLTPADIGFDGLAPENWSAGNAFAFVPVRGLDALARSRTDFAHWERAFPSSPVTGAFLFCRGADHGTYRARMYAPAAGVPEDPATGSAAAAFAGWLARHVPLADGEHEFRIEQGYEMGRPSRISVTLSMRKGALEAASVGGEAVAVSEGTIEA